jgi:thiol-disulfide isomerase/thioredoxin
MSMRFVLLLGAVAIALNVNAQTPASKLLTELNTKREALPALHQEFEATQTTKTDASSRGLHRDLVVDISQGKWRERSITGFGDRVRIFDGQGQFVMETDGDEYIKIDRKVKEPAPEPGPYGADLEWAKATEVKRQPCGLSANDHTCLIVDVPVKKWMRADTNGKTTRLSDGVSRLAFDTETGVLIQSVTQEVIETSRINYEVDLTYSLKRMNYGTAPDESLFKLPEGLHEVKEFARWNAARIKKQLVGKPAPELEVTDMDGKPVSLSDFKGKTVLLDFWATWCPPCRADAPALDKLNRKYGEKDLAIVGVSVSEERDVVEKFLKSHPHGFPIVLTSENEMPRPYQIAIFPTYMVIAPDGTLTTAVEGDQGFAELRKFLEKAGMEVE